MMTKLKAWWFDNCLVGVPVFGVMMLCFFPILGKNTKPDPTLYDIHQTALTQEKRYRLDVLVFKDNKRTIYFNCNWFESNICQHASPDLLAQNATYQTVDCNYTECSAIMHQGTFLKGDESITYQASPAFIDHAFTLPLSLNRMVRTLFAITVLGFLLSLITSIKRLTAK